GRAIAIDEAVQAPSAVMASRVFSNLTSVRCYRSGLSTATVVDSGQLGVFAAAELPVASTYNPHRRLARTTPSNGPDWEAALPPSWPSVIRLPCRSRSR